MILFNNHNQRILVSALLHSDEGKMLVVRSTHMKESLNDSEYFCMPSWELPFGANPKEKVLQELRELLDEDVEIKSINSTLSYLQEDKMTHVIEIIYNASASRDACKNIEMCQSVRFLDKHEIDAYILSDRIKDILREYF